MFKGSISIIDDDEDVLYTARLILKNQFKTVKTFSKPEAALKDYISTPADVLLLDMNYKTGATSGNEGLYWLQEFKKLDPDVHIILNTAYGDINIAVNGMKLGAIDFLVKPWEQEKLLATTRNVYELKKSRKRVKKLEGENDFLNAEITSNLGELIYKSEAMKRVVESINKVSPTHANVLILGENGVGKELVARMIHNNSSRSSESFVKVDVGSITHSLFESELFGHVKGAFTDAITDKQGRFEIANNGSLFLDEIGNISLESQAKLLSTLQNRVIIKVGSVREIPFDIRLISATNRDINEMISLGEFREDLYFRINTVEIFLPPLRNRIGDIPLLAEHFLSKYASSYGKEGIEINSKAMSGLNNYQWPGNVRELDHAIERAVIMADSLEIGPQEFALHRSIPTDSTTKNLNVDEIEKGAIEQAISRFNGNLSKAALELGMGRSTLYRKIKKYKIDI